MAVEFMDLLGEPELEIGHAKKVLFSSAPTPAAGTTPMPGRRRATSPNSSQGTPP